jgi:hypothetical protein
LADLEFLVDEGVLLHKGAAGHQGNQRHEDHRPVHFCPSSRERRAKKAPAEIEGEPEIATRMTSGALPKHSFIIIAKWGRMRKG